MAQSPVVVLLIVTATLGFQALLFGAELAERSFPTFEQPSSGGFFGALDALLGLVQGVWGVIMFVFNLVTFNVPGAPWFVRLVVGSVIGGSIVWSVATLFRGT